MTVHGAHPNAAHGVRATCMSNAVATTIVENALKEYQLGEITSYIEKRGYVKKAHPRGAWLDTMTPGRFTFNYPVMTAIQAGKVTVPVDAMIQSRIPRPSRLPIMVEVKSSANFTNTQKPRSEAKTVNQLKATFANDVCYVAFLCGYFDCGYLGYDAADGIDWVWAHRLDDFAKLGIY